MNGEEKLSNICVVQVGLFPLLKKIRQYRVEVLLTDNHAFKFRTTTVARSRQPELSTLQIYPAKTLPHTSTE